AEERSRGLEIRERRGPGLVLALDRRALAEARNLSVPQLDLDDIVLVARLAGDHERLRQLQRGDPGGQLHGRNTNSAFMQWFFAPRDKGGRMKGLIVLATGILTALALTAVPATAGHQAAYADVCSGWEAAGAGVFDSLGSIASAQS